MKQTFKRFFCSAVIFGIVVCMGILLSVLVDLLFELPHWIGIVFFIGFCVVYFIGIYNALKD